MKKLIFILMVILFQITHCFSQINDTIIHKNELGFGISSMTNSNLLCLSYKRFFNKINLRSSLFIYKDGDEAYLASGQFINDSNFVITTYRSKKNNYGLRLGLDKSKNITNNLSYFYGLDLMATIIKENYYSAKTLYYNNTPNKSSYGGELNYQKLYGKRFGIIPVIGIKQYILSYFSFTLEANIIASYTKIDTKSSTIDLDENFKFLLSYNF